MNARGRDRILADSPATTQDSTTNWDYLLIERPSRVSSPFLAVLVPFFVLAREETVPATADTIMNEGGHLFDHNFGVRANVLLHYRRNTIAPASPTFVSPPSSDG